MQGAATTVDASCRLKKAGVHGRRLSVELDKVSLFHSSLAPYLLVMRPLPFLSGDPCQLVWQVNETGWLLRRRLL